MVPPRCQRVSSRTVSQLQTLPIKPIVVGAGHEVGACALTEAVACVQADVEAEEEALCLRSHRSCSVEVFLTLGKAQSLTDPG